MIHDYHYRDINFYYNYALYCRYSKYDYIEYSLQNVLHYIMSISG